MASPSHAPPDHGADSVETRSPELRKDPVTNRWVIFSPARAKRPTDFKSKSPENPNPKPSSCPFCIGREHECAPEIFRVPPDDDPNWKIRVIENLYPALSRNLETQSNHQSATATSRTIVGFGFHDVVIEAPLHSIQLSDIDPVGIGDVLIAYRKRIEQIAKHYSINYIQVFKNHGASAGASMSHSHSQIMALPVVPPTVSSRLDGTKDYFEETGKCCLCEAKSKHFVIDESSHFVSVAPYASTYPFEVWIVPKDHSSHFHHLDDVKAVDLGGLLKLMLQKIAKQLNGPPYNYMIHTSPLKVTESQLPYTHWFLQIVPQLSGVGGFEMGSGCYINPVFPEDVAKVLREVSLT
ncbi:hypothetical protein Bca4012_045885 [Brassica carinata]|uniref:Galactose-1-phosphate uridyl transferase N-terminal domain-containing protein n=2 Tax=Brassica TaxID=3705 RepID=A0A0D3EEI7_BRAOL|nr:PREDICTED: ADP-glucose phosphorylase [Brassica oleracea var. oleracea]KAG2273634.1 hypothetical protein Bca52824_056189 [Brassica carinata]